MGGDGCITAFREATNSMSEITFFLTWAWLSPGKSVVDTTGAGDCFIGGLAYAYAQKWALPQVVEFAAHIAGHAVTALGPRPGVPRVHGKLTSDFEESLQALKMAP